MAWEQRGRRLYYYRSVREGGRVRKEYVGTGPTAAAIARLETLDRDRREWQRSEERREREDLDAADRPLQEFCEVTDALARAALLLAGYRQHARGHWRKRRG